MYIKVKYMCVRVAERNMAYEVFPTEVYLETGNQVMFTSQFPSRPEDRRTL